MAAGNGTVLAAQNRQRRHASMMQSLTGEGAPTLLRTSMRAYAASYLVCLSNLLNAMDLDALEDVVRTLRTARDEGASTYVIGNGGSAATASHFATDLVNMSKRVGKPLKAMSLVDNTAWLTAQANDTGYDNVFSGQLETFAAPGDVLIVISASGNSPSLIGAVKLATSRGMTTIGFLGFDGGILLGLVDTAVHVRSTPGFYGPVEDVHLALQHIVSGCLAET